MIMNRHHTAVSLCGEEISKGMMGASIVTMDACNSEKLSEQNIEVPPDITRAIPGWLFPNCENTARHQSRPDAVLVQPILGRPTHPDPKQISAHDRDILLN